MPFAYAGKTDLFVIGGGPAGLAAAIAATKKGFSVTLADGAAPPVEKPCGEGLMPETQAALSELGLSLAPEEGYSFRGMRFAQHGAQVSADFPSGTGIGLRRTLLHQKLIARAEQCGVRMLWKTPVCGIEPGGVILSSGFHPARWIVGADGCGSRVRRWSGLDKTRRKTQRHALRRHYAMSPWSEYMEIYWGCGVQAYITPVGPEEVCIVMIADSPEKVRFDEALENWPDLKLRLAHQALGSRERGIVSYMHSLRAVHKDNVALVGDASGGVDAITGEGLRLAFRQAAALASALQQNNLRYYAEAHSKLARRPTIMGHVLLTLSRGERFRARVVQEFAKNPKLFSQFMAIHCGNSAPSQLLFTGAALGWRLLTA